MDLKNEKHHTGVNQIQSVITLPNNFARLNKINKTIMFERKANLSLKPIPSVH